MALILAVLGAVFVAAGAASQSLSAGLVAAGVELLAAAYIAAYFKHGGHET